MLPSTSRRTVSLLVCRSLPPRCTDDCIWVAGTHRSLWDEIPFVGEFVADPTGPVLPDVGELSSEGVNERLEPTIGLVLDRFPTGIPDETDRFTIAEGTPWADARGSIDGDSQDRPIIPRTEIDH